MLFFLISFYSGTQIDKIKYKYNLDNYDRIVAFMNGKDPNEVKSSEKGIYLLVYYLLFYSGFIFMYVLFEYIFNRDILKY